MDIPKEQNYIYDINIVLLFVPLASMRFRFSYVLIQEQNVYAHFARIEHRISYILFLISIRDTVSESSNSMKSSPSPGIDT